MKPYLRIQLGFETRCWAFLGCNGEWEEKNNSSIEGSLPIEYILNYFQDHSGDHLENHYLWIPVCLKHATKQILKFY